MSTLGSKLITKELQWNSNMTELNHLGKALLIKPHLMSKMDTIFSSQNYYSDNPLLTQIMGKAQSEETINGTTWEWELKGANSRPGVIMEDLTGGDTAQGKFKTAFKIKLDINWYKPGDVLNPGTSNKKFQVRVIDQVQKSGNGFIYNVVGMTDDPAWFMPSQYLTIGNQWAKLFSQYEEGAEQSGSMVTSLPIGLRNKMSKFRKEYKITDYASTQVLAIAIPDTKGKFHTSWMKYAEVEYWQQWYRELERAAWYTRSTDSVLGSTGRAVTSGPGIQEQLEDSHIHHYTHLTTKLIEEYLMDIFYSRTKPGKGRKIKGFTGEYGMMLFHNAVQDFISKKGFIQNVEVFTNKVSSEYNDNALAAGYQFVRYRMANGSELELIHNPLYDDRDINFEIDPISGYPVESQRITFLDFSGDSGESNIKLMKKAQSDTFNYIVGNFGPYGPIKDGYAAHSGDYYEMHVGTTRGVHINDITKCGELILSRN